MDIFLDVLFLFAHELENYVRLVTSVDFLTGNLQNFALYILGNFFLLVVSGLQSIVEDSIPASQQNNLHEMKKNHNRGKESR